MLQIIQNFPLKRYAIICISDKYFLKKKWLIWFQNLYFFIIRAEQITRHELFRVSLIDYATMSIMTVGTGSVKSCPARPCQGGRPSFHLHFQPLDSEGSCETRTWELHRAPACVGEAGTLWRQSSVVFRGLSLIMGALGLGQCQSEARVQPPVH